MKCPFCDTTVVVKDGEPDCLCGRCADKPCDMCGEAASMRYLGQDLCDDCAPSEDYRFTACSICNQEIDIEESRVPLCNPCQGTAKAHARLEREAGDWIGQEGAGFGSK